MTSQRRILFKSLWICMFFTGIWVIGASPLGAKEGYTNRDDLFSMCFVNNQSGWTCGRWGTIFHTVDGGKTWHEQNSGVRYTLGGIYFADDKNGWAVGNMGTIVHTSDGGMTWEKQDSPVDFYHMDVYFASRLKGWIVSEQTHILYTQDGGKTWEVQFSDEDFILKSVSFSGENHGFAVGEFGHIYRTIDGGKIWEKQAGGVIINDIGDLEGDPFLFDVTMIDKNTAWAVGIEGRVIMTEDGGNTWIPVETGSPNTQLFSITYNRDKTLVIAGKGVCLISENLGQTWRDAVFDPQIDYTWIYAVETIDLSHFTACGEDGGTYIGSLGHFKKVR
jgi:photosystem II stability/assembly factor-like uncharacterized protein